MIHHEGTLKTHLTVGSASLHTYPPRPRPRKLPETCLGCLAGYENGRQRFYFETPIRRIAVGTFFSHLTDTHPWQNSMVFTWLGTVLNIRSKSLRVERIRAAPPSGSGRGGSSGCIVSCTSDFFGYRHDALEEVLQIRSKIFFGDMVIGIIGRFLHELVVVERAVTCSAPANGSRCPKVPDTSKVITQRRDTSFPHITDQGCTNPQCVHLCRVCQA